MQKLNEVKRKNVVIKIENKKNTLDCKKINNDILYKISCITPNIYRVLPKLYNVILNKDNIIRLKVDGTLKFTPELDFFNYKNIQHLHLKDLRTIKLKNSKIYLNCFILESIDTIDFIFNSEIKTQKLILNNCKMKPDNFYDLLDKLKPKALVLNHINLIGYDDNCTKIFKLIEKLKLLQLESNYSFIDKKYILKQMNNLNTVSYKSKSSMFYQSFNKFNILKIANLELPQNIHFNNNYEILYLEDVLYYNSKFAQNVKHLILKKVNLYPSFLKGFKNLITVDFTECYFPNLLFYDFIISNPKLQSFTSRNTEIPLDSVQFIKRYYNNCSVNIKNN